MLDILYLEPSGLGQSAGGVEQESKFSSLSNVVARSSIY